METALWFILWLLVGCLVFYIAYRIVNLIFSSDPPSARIATIILGVLAFLALISYCYYSFPGVDHQLLRR